MKEKSRPTYWKGTCYFFRVLVIIILTVATLCSFLSEHPKQALFDTTYPHDYFATERGAKYCDLRVCLSVCLFVCLFVSHLACLKNHLSILHEIFLLPVAVARSSSGF